MKIIITLLIALSYSLSTLADGTKNMFVTQSDTATKIFGINSVGKPSSGEGSNMNCPEYRRIRIRIVNPTIEKICLGFNKGGGGSQFFRVFDPTGGIAVPGTPIPTSGAGFIKYYKEVFIGPSLSIPGGYNPLVINPTIAGDYWIEFNDLNNFTSTTTNGDINIFDISVVNTFTLPGAVIDGRVYCKQWNFKHTGGSGNDFNGPIYSYTNDSVINRISFNGIVGNNWYLCMNNFGCANATTITANNRKSIIGNASMFDTVADFKLFLTLPDTSTFKLTNITTPTLTFINTIITPNCSNNGAWDSIYRFTLNSSISSNVNLTIDLNGIPGYQPLTVDVSITTTLGLGTNTINWNGYNGLGAFVSPGIIIPLSATVNLGETHIPLFDIENLPVGFTANTILPVALINNPTLHFDDTNISGGNSNIAGCIAPCHNFNSIGNQNTVNTWFYSKQIVTAQSYSLVTPVKALAISNTSVNCFAACNVSANLSHTLGIAPFSYSWTPANQTSQTALNLCAGSYTAKVTDVNGCVSSSSLVVSQPSSLTAIVSTTNNSNCATPNGIASVSISGGIPAYSYTWSPGTQTTNVVSGLSNVIYTVTIKDLKNCTVTALANISNPPNPTINVVSNTSVICLGNNATLTPSGASVYSISGLATTNTFVSTCVVSPTVTTTYTIVGTNASNCLSNSVIQSIAVNIIPTLTISANNNTICSGQVATLTATGANTYTLNPGNFTGNQFVINPLTTTQYSIIGTSIQGCNANPQTFNLNVNQTPTLTLATTNSTICSGQTITLTASGANTYTLNPGNIIGNSFVLNPTTTTQYSVVGASNQSCTSNPLPFNLTVNQNPTLTLAASNKTICSGQTITLTASGANTYTLNPGNFTGNNFVINPLTTTEYSIVGTSTQGCLALNNGYTNITVKANPTVNISASNHTLCTGKTITLTASGANSYTWFPKNTNAITLVITPSSSETYSLIGSKDNCVSAIAIQSIQIYNLPTPVIAASNAQGCQPLSTTLSLHGNTNITEVNWLVDGITYNQINAPEHCFINSGIQKVTAFVTDKNNCNNVINYSVTVFPKPEADFSYATVNPVINESSRVDFTDLTASAPISSWTWYFTNNENETSDQQNPSYNYVTEGTHPVVLLVKSNKGCSDTVIKSITVQDDFGIYVPNAFTPNKDGLNDIFQPKGFGMKQYELSIFDRWGTQLFQSNDLLIGWDGSYKNEISKDDIYIWNIKAASLQGKIYVKTGTITLIK